MGLVGSSLGSSSVWLLLHGIGPVVPELHATVTELSHGHHAKPVAARAFHDQVAKGVSERHRRPRKLEEVHKSELICCSICIE